MSEPSRLSPWTLATVALVVLSVLVMAYALIVLQQILLGLVVVGMLVGLYVLLRVIAAIEAIADALQRVASEMERSE